MPQSGGLFGAAPSSTPAPASSSAPQYSEEQLASIKAAMMDELSISRIAELPLADRPQSVMRMPPRRMKKARNPSIPQNSPPFPHTGQTHSFQTMGFGGGSSYQAPSNPNPFGNRSPTTTQAGSLFGNASTLR